MIRGLTWANVRWIVLFLLILAMSATADGYLRLNYSCVMATWSALESGWKGFVQWQTGAARDLDQASQTRYGFDPFDPRVANCVSTPNSTAVLRSEDLAKLTTTKPKDRAAVIQAIGEPFCKEVSGYEIWLVGSSQYLQAEYNPVKYQVKNATPASSRN